MFDCKSLFCCCKGSNLNSDIEEDSDSNEDATIKESSEDKAEQNVDAPIEKTSGSDDKESNIFETQVLKENESPSATIESHFSIKTQRCNRGNCYTGCSRVYTLIIYSQQFSHSLTIL